MKSLLHTLLASALLVSAASAGSVAPTTAPPQQQQQQPLQPGVVNPGTGGLAPTGNLVVFQVDTFEDGKITEGTVRVADAYLGNNPAVDVKLAIPGIKCDKDSFSFVQACKDKTGYKVKCRPEGCVQKAKDGDVLTLAATFEYELKSAAQTQRPQRPKETQDVKRRVKNCGSGQGEGDPHIKNLDGAKFDFQIPGMYSMFESGALKIQVFQDRCMMQVYHGEFTPSCYKGAAIAFGDAIVRFFLEKGKIVVAKGSESYQQWLDVKKIDGQSDGYRVFTKADTSSYVDVTVGSFKGENYMNVALQISPYFRTSSVKGIMGNWDGVKQAEESNADALAKTFKLDLKQNLLACTDCASLSGKASAGDSTALTVASPLGLLEQGFSSFLVTQKRSFSLAITPLSTKKLRRELAAKDVSPRAKQLCSQVITSIPHCAKYVADVSYYVDSYCIGDATLLQDLSVVDVAKVAYLRECRRGLDSRIEANSTTPVETATLRLHRDELSFGDLMSCAKDCSGAGECLAAGCKCNGGVTGFACDIKTAQ